MRTHPPTPFSAHLRALQLVNLILVGCLPLACGKVRASPPIGPQALMAAVRSYSRPAEPAPAGQSAFPKAQSSVASLQTESAYKAKIESLLTSASYDQLEQEAHDDRANKERIVGGVWRLYTFYDALSQPAAESGATERDWTAHLAAIKRWNLNRPECATARIALAGSYVNYAWFARGSGYADSVSGKSWQLFGERFELAKATLLEAGKMKDKCPYWFELVQQTALAEGWDKPLATEIFEKAVAFEPTYYHFYREYANFLQTKWYGEEGEVQNFAEQIADRVGGDDGDLIYFEIASLVACQCQSDRAPLVGLSWPRIQSGYLVLRQRYGVTNLKMNRFALMAYSSDDRTAASQVFGEIGDNREYTVWKNQQTFEEARTWAASR